MKMEDIYDIEETDMETQCEEDPSYRPIFPYILDVKLFAGAAKDVEAEIKEFIKNHPIHIRAIRQSGDSGSTTVSIFYYAQEEPRYINKEMTYDVFSRELMNHFEKKYGVDINDIIDLWERKAKERKGT